MENKYKSYKDYMIKTEQWETDTKIKNINDLLKATKESINALKDWEIDRFSNYLTTKQFELLKNRDMDELK